MSELVLRTVAAITAGAIALSACQPRRDEEFQIVNRTQETIAVRWKSNDTPLATLTPGSSTSMGAPDGWCDGKSDTALIATSEKGNTYFYGPKICGGEDWFIEG
ncbi:hypothetical protein GT755_01940 [Herbidospora sp. NEAU-GS84]|uniref:Uncharacterized protein n=1 Tax=Herbidospora solisilvae TaxID=2696284 RepID=A0A7C9J029_9ACTN|nr:hypothetical protein [Herbidospora solisilvae]NAS20442.1 hypothetical protein [Herbidospora solisilvae]